MGVQKTNSDDTTRANLNGIDLTKDLAMVSAIPAWDIPAGKADLMIRVRVFRGTMIQRGFKQTLKLTRKIGKKKTIS